MLGKTIVVPTGLCKGSEWNYLDIFKINAYDQDYTSNAKEELYNKEEIQGKLVGNTDYFHVDENASIMRGMLESYVGEKLDLVAMLSYDHVFDIYKDKYNNYYGVYAGNWEYSGDHCEIVKINTDSADWIWEDWDEWKLYLEETLGVDVNDYRNWLKENY